MSAEFSGRLTRQIELAETLLLESYVNETRDPARPRSWAAGTRVILEGEFGASSGIVELFGREVRRGPRRIGGRDGYEKALEACLEILSAVRDAVAPVEDGDH